MNPGVAYVIRHGQTDSNVAQLYAGRSPEHLNKTGLDEVLTLSHGLAACGFEAIWTSSIERARETAAIIGTHLDLSVCVDHRLDEMRLGVWEGLTEEDTARRFPVAHRVWLSEPDQLRLEGRETLAQLTERVMSAVRDAANSGKRLLLVTHVAPIRVAVLSVLGQPLRLYKRIEVPNASCHELDLVHGVVVKYPSAQRILVDDAHRSLAF